MAVRDQTDDPGDALWRRRWRLLLSGTVALTLILVVTLEYAQSWHLPLFLGGLVPGTAVAAGLFIVVRKASRSGAMRLRTRRRAVIGQVSWLYLGTAVGLMASMINSPFPDIALVVFIGIGIGAVAFTIRNVKRRMAARSTLD